MPVSTRTRPAGVSTTRQFRAWFSRFWASISSTVRRSQRIFGTGPKSTPASDRNQPARTSETRVPPPRSADQSSASFIGHGQRASSLSPVLRPVPSPKSRWNADAVGSDWPWYFDPSPALPYGRSTALDIWKNEIWPMRIPK